MKARHRPEYRCNELGFFEDGAPTGRPSIASRLMVPSYVEVRAPMIILPDPPYTDAPRGSQRQCAYTFPGAPNFNGSATPIPAVTSFNNLYKGVNMKGANLFFANGQREFCFLASRRSLPKHWRGCRRSMEGCDRFRRWTVRRQHLNAANWCLRRLPLLRPHHQERSN